MPENLGVNPEEQRVDSPELAEEMAYAEKPFREEAREKSELLPPLTAYAKIFGSRERTRMLEDVAKTEDLASKAGIELVEEKDQLEIPRDPFVGIHLERPENEISGSKEQVLRHVSKLKPTEKYYLVRASGEPWERSGGEKNAAQRLSDVIVKTDRLILAARILWDSDFKASSKLYRQACKANEEALKRRVEYGSYLLGGIFDDDLHKSSKIWRYRLAESALRGGLIKEYLEYAKRKESSSEWSRRMGWSERKQLYKEQYGEDL